MQSINVTAVRPAFMLLIFGTCERPVRSVRRRRSR
jgi:hypothetical protein